MSLDDVSLHARLDAMTDEELDALDYGVVKMDREGVVTAYNAKEIELSGIAKDRVIGKNFFVEVAPCTNNFMVAHRYRSEEELDDTIDYVFTLKMRPTPVKLHLMKSQAASSMFLAVHRS